MHYKSPVVGAFSLLPPKGESRTYRLVQSPKVLIITALIIAPFCLPYFFSDGFLGGEINDLFDLVFFLFSAFWFLGWSMVVGAMLLVLLVMLLARERIVLQPGRLIVRLECLGVGFSRYFHRDTINDMQRLAEPEENSGVSWRGPHVIFFSDGERVSMGLNISEAEAHEIAERVGQVVLIHPPPADSPKTWTRPEKSAEAAPQKNPALPQEPAGHLSSIALVLANCLPIFGVVSLGWSVGDIMLIYWAESAVIGFYNLARMWVIGRWAVLFMGPFFLGHYGGFMVGHLLFIYGFMIQGPAGSQAIPLQQVMADFVLLAPALLALFVSHGVSFFTNFVGRREYVGRSLRHQMSEPYKRIVLMHVTLIFGGFLALTLGSSLPALLLMIALKIGADLRSHLGMHRARTAPPAS